MQLVELQPSEVLCAKPAHIAGSGAREKEDRRVVLCALARRPVAAVICGPRVWSGKVADDATWR
jgi:hypothetical protein